MKEVIQLNLTEEEAIILEAIVAVGTSIYPLRRDLTEFEREVCCMATFMDKWLEASESLADKMTNLVKISKKMSGIK